MKTEIVKKLLEQGKSTVYIMKEANCSRALITYCKDQKYLSREYFIERRNKTKRKAVEYRGGKCQCCGYDRCLAALEFHHVDPTLKDKTIESMTKGAKAFNTIKDELDKCLLVCSRCHREIHTGIFYTKEQINEKYKQSYPTDKFFISNKITKLQKNGKCPDKDILQKMIEESTIVSIAKHFNVSDTTIDNWRKKLEIEIPKRK